MAETSIEWTDHSINPIRARQGDSVGHYCEKISDGCTNCYASRMQKRFTMPSFGSGQKRGEVECFLDESKLQEVLRRKKPTRYFWCDMTDLFGEWVPDEWIDKCFAAMALTPQHTHQVLTKRPSRALGWFQSGKTLECGFGEPPETFDRKGLVGINCNGFLHRGPNGRRIDNAYPTGSAVSSGRMWPIPNVWLGTSVENQEQADKRIPELLRVPAAVRFLSMEPLLGPVDLKGCMQPLGYGWVENHCTGPEGGSAIDWVIVGGESGPHARPMHPQWARDIRDQCEAAGVPYFFKQWGEWLPVATPRVGKEHLVMNAEGSLMEGDWESVMQTRGNDWGFARVGKKAAGRLLDGREWNQMPFISGEAAE